MIVAAMIVGPGEGWRYLDRTLRQIGRWADKVYVYTDTGTDDDTIAAVIRSGAVWGQHYGRSFTQCESDVRNGLFNMLDGELELGDLVVVIDADEELQTQDGRVSRETLERMYHDDTVGQWQVQFFHLWSPDGGQYRVDGGWAPHNQTRIYRFEPGLRVPEKAMACAAVPPGAGPLLAHDTPDLRMLHWGYARPHDRPVKHARYVAHDGGAFHNAAHIASIVTDPTLAPLPFTHRTR